MAKCDTVEVNRDGVKVLVNKEGNKEPLWSEKPSPVKPKPVIKKVSK